MIGTSESQDQFFDIEEQDTGVSRPSLLCWRPRLGSLQDQVCDVVDRVRPIPQFTYTSDTDTFGLLRYRYRYHELFDDNGRWLIQTSV